MFYKQGVGISLSGCGNRASHNLIHDGPRMGLMFSGNNLIMEYNHIRHMNLETEDTGAIYTGGRDWISSRGSIIRYNYIHDMPGYDHNSKGEWPSPGFAWGIYLDDNAGGMDLIGNIIARCSRASLHLHNGRDNYIDNNVFIDGGQAQIEYSGWTESSRAWAVHLPTMIKGYASVAGQIPWLQMRGMSQAPEAAILPDKTIMAGNVFTHNIIYYHNPKSKLYGFRNLSFTHNEFNYNLIWHFNQVLLNGIKDAPAPEQWAAWLKLGADENSLVADPLFINAEKDDYRLKGDSPAFALGFATIPMKEIGPYQDALRATWPIIEAEGAREFHFPLNANRESPHPGDSSLSR